VRELLETQPTPRGGEDESDVVADADVVHKGVVRDRGTW
jgi:hypothetical protein